MRDWPTHRRRALAATASRLNYARRARRARRRGDAISAYADLDRLRINHTRSRQARRRRDLSNPTEE